jgi:hypothetical protein
MRERFVWLGLACALNVGCTFITSCPDPNAMNGDPGAAGTAASGGSGNTGGGNGGGSGGSGGVDWVIDGEWRNVTANLANIESECGNMSSVFAKPDEDLLIAGVAGKGLWASSDGGESWSELGTGAGSDVIVHRPTQIVFDPTDSDTWWEAGIYHPEAAGIYVTRDNGQTFRALPDTYHVDAIAIDFADDERSLILAGGHEVSKVLFKSVDGGQSWEDIGDGLPEGTDCTRPYIVDANTYLVSCGGYRNPGEEAGPVGVFRSVDAGDTWESVSEVGGGLVVKTSGERLFATGAANTPGALARSDDAEGATWSSALAMGQISNVPLVELPNGLLAGLNERRVVVSNDEGQSWTPVTPDLEFVGGGVIYSAQRKSFFVWHATCGFDGAVLVPEDAIMGFDFDYEAFPTSAAAP